MPFPTSALDAPMPPDLLRILQTRYLDPHGFWQFLPAATEVSPNTRRIAWHFLEILLYFFIAAGCFTPLYLFIARLDGGHPPPQLLLGLKIIAWTAGLGIFAFAFLARSLQLFLDLRRGPWLRILPAQHAIELPRHHLTVPCTHIEWALLRSQHTIDRRPSTVTELTLTLRLPAHCCISVTPRYGRRSYHQLERLATALATATHAPLTLINPPTPDP